MHIEFSGENIPYYAFGRAYIRVGDEDKQLSAKELEKIILDKNKHKLAWDKEVCKEAKISDIEIGKLKQFLKKAGKTFDNVENSLKKLGLLSRGKLLNTAVILFAKNPENFFPIAKVRCATFATTDSTMPLDMQEFAGNLFTLVEKAEQYILGNIHIGMKLEGLKRIDVPEINRDAFREALLNAFCHRNYHIHQEVHVAIFRDRMEIRSPGLLFRGLTIERIIKEEVSELRNPLIAQIFHQIHWIEKWGQGIGKILRLEPKTQFKELGRQFYVTFKRKEVSRERLVEGLGDKLGERLGENQKKIIELIHQDKYISIPKIAEKISISTTAVENNITKLKKKGIIKRIGSAKSGYWEIVKKG